MNEYIRKKKEKWKKDEEKYSRIKGLYFSSSFLKERKIWINDE